jgi:hypothetical protein
LVLTDGRNRYVTALMWGIRYLFVAWLCPPAENVGGGRSARRGVAICPLTPVTDPDVAAATIRRHEDEGRRRASV